MVSVLPLPGRDGTGAKLGIPRWSDGSWSRVIPLTRPMEERIVKENTKTILHGMEFSLHFCRTAGLQSIHCPGARSLALVHSFSLHPNRLEPDESIVFVDESGTEGPPTRGIGW